VISERRGRWLLNLYPPLLCQRIRIVSIAPGFTACRVRVARSLLTRNLFGTTFGGTIFSAADPIHAVLYWQVFARRGKSIQAWLKSARVDYRKPAATALTLDFALTEGDVSDAEAALAREGRFVRTFRTEAIDAAGDVCAVIETEVYLRLPRGEQKEVSAF
jgi:acyl-coenzyme A thioesterase PaaI-like protein